MGIVHKVKRAAAAAQSSRSSTAASSPVSSPAAAAPISKYPRFGKRGAPQAFPSKLYQILEEENADVIGWTSTGRGFEVRDHARLSSEVLGRFFKQDKFSSFQRQLNLYGFRKITKGNEAGSYQHTHFRRGERTTLLTIRRSIKTPAARVVPSSPAASGVTPPAVPLSSTVVVSTAASSKARSATPSPPPAPVRGILPWPRPPPNHSGSLSGSNSEARGVSPDVSGIDGSDREVPAAGRLGVADTSSTKSDDNRREDGVRMEEACVRANESKGSARYSGCVESPGRAGHGNARGDWKEIATRPMETGGNTDGVYPERTSRWEEVSEKRDGERAQGLDHRDVEVAGLLQRMAKDAQDSPSRQRPSPQSSRWEGQTEGNDAESSRLQHLPPFRMPKPQGGSDGAQQSQQMVFAERLYDILNHERVNNVPRDSYPYAFTAADGRTASIAHHPLARLPAPFPTSTPASRGTLEPPGCGGRGMLDSGRHGLPGLDSGSHGHPGFADDRERPYHHTGQRQQQLEGGPMYESGASRSTGEHGVPLSYSYEGRGVTGEGRRAGAEVEGFRRGHWQGPEGPYAAPSTLRKYEVGENGNMGVVGGSVRAEDLWVEHRPYEGGR